MNKKILILLSFISAVLIITIASPQTGTLNPSTSVSWAHYYRDLKELTMQSDIIVVGKVVAVHHFTDGNPPLAFNDYSFQVERVLKGAVNGAITVRQTAGVEDDPAFELGDRLILFLHNCTPDGITGVYYTLGGPQGRFVLDNGMVFSVSEVYPSINTASHLNVYGQSEDQFIDMVQSYLKSP
jgi:hypothetical protein